MWSKNVDIPKFKQLVKIMFMYQPLELTKWLLEKNVKLYSNIVDAKYINQSNEGKMYAVPEKKEKEKDDYNDNIKKSISDMVVNTAKNDGLELEEVHIDWEESARQTIAKGGCDIEILFTFQLEDGSTRQGILAVPIIEPPNDGSRLIFDIVSTMSWQVMAFEEYIINPQIEVKDESEIDGTPYIIYTPLFLWHGTGLKDTGEYCMLIPTDIENELGFLGELIKSSREPDYLEHRRENNLFRKRVYEENDRERRAAAKKRAELMGDPMITEEELDELCTEVNIDKDEYTLWLKWKSKRVWEHSVAEMLEELPVCGLGLAFFAYNTAEETCQDVFQQCVWKLRARVTELNLSKKEKERAIVCLATTAYMWLSDEEITATMKKFKLI